MKENKIAVIGLSGESIFMKVDHFHAEGETVVAQNYHKEYGGKGFNQAIAIARCNEKISFLSIVANDQIGIECERTLLQNKVTPFLIKSDVDGSASACIIINKEGQNRVTCFPGVSKYLSKFDVFSFEEEIKTSRILLLQLETSRESLISAVDIANKYDTRVILNPAPATILPQELIDKCYLLTPNEQEVKVIFNINSELTDEVILTLPVNRIVITLGEKGSVLKEFDKLYYFKPLKVKCINSTGAGDTFNGILAAFMLKGYSLQDACKYATIGSSISVSREYVIDSIPYYKEIVEEK